MSGSSTTVFVLFLSIISLWCGCHSYVIQLNQVNAEKTLKANSHFLLCVYKNTELSKEGQSVFNALSEKHLKHKSNIKFGRISYDDALTIQETIELDENEVFSNKMPILILLNDSADEVEKYSKNDFTVDSISFWLEKRIGDVVREIKDFKQIEKLLGLYEILILYFGSVSDKEFIVFEQVASKSLHLEFVILSLKQSRSFTGFSEKAQIGILKNFDERKVEFTLNKINTENLNAFLNENILPTISKMSELISDLLYATQKTAIFLYYDHDSNTKEEKVLYEIAQELKQNHSMISVLVSDTSELEISLMDYVKVTKADFPCIRIHVPRFDHIDSYSPSTSEISLTGILKFVNEYRSGALVPDESKIETSYVQEADESSFKTLVLDPKVNIIAYFYSGNASCKRCIEFDEIFEKASEIYKDIDFIQFVKINTEAKEVYNIKVTDDYVVLLFPPYNKDKAVRFYPRGYLNLNQDFLHFIRENHQSLNPEYDVSLKVDL